MTLRHYGKFKNEEVLVLGYKKSMNACMICRFMMLPADEQAQLRQIASSTYAQSNCDYLIPVLYNERHKSGNDWFTYLAGRFHRADGSVISIPLKNIEELDQDQKAFFKGWGKSIAEAKTAREQGHEFNDVLDDLKGYTPITPVQETQTQAPPPAATQTPMTAVEVPEITEEEAKPYVDREAMMLQLMQQMVDGQQKIAEGMQALEKKVGARKTTPRKKVGARKKATAKLAVPPVEHGDAVGKEAAPEG